MLDHVWTSYDNLVEAGDVSFYVRLCQVGSGYVGMSYYEKLYQFTSGYFWLRMVMSE
jgi:hypothetical protein